METLHEFGKRMRALGSGELLRSLQNEMKSIGMNTEREAKLNASNGGTGPNVVTGRLRSSIHASVQFTGTNIEVHARAGGHSRQTYLSGINTPPTQHGDVHYAALQEFGGPGVTAKSFLRSGVQKALKKAPESIAKSVKMTILGQDDLDSLNPGF